jgi:hypothetical protein
MAVEILVLSGARQGERIGLDTTEFRAGAESDCAVCFDPRIDAGAANRSVTFRLMDDGWYVVRAAHGVLVNQQAVAPPARMRAGDVVRMSERGPDFVFSIVARLSAAPAASPAMTPGYASGAASPWAAPLAMTQAAPLLTPAPTPLPAAFPAAQPAGLETPAAPIVVGEYAAPAPVAVQPVEQVARSVVPAASGGGSQALLFLLGGGLVACVLLVVAAHVLSPPAPPQPQPPAPVVILDPRGQPVTPPGATPVQPPTTPGEKPKTGEIPPPEPTIVKPPPSAVEQRIYEQLKDAVYLIQVEKSGSYWPVATCCAVGDSTLLTTAREASDLAAWRNDPQKAFKVWITRPSESAGKGAKEGDGADAQVKEVVKLEVKDIRIHTGYTVLADTPDWIYCDVGLLTVEGKLPKVAALASAKELDGLKDGQPVFCFGFPHEGEKVTEFDQVEPRLSRSKIFVTTVQRKLPGQPRLLHVKGEIPPIACGSPIVNDQGKVLALYGSAALAPEGAKEKDVALVKNLHYAPGVDPELIEKWLKQQDSTTWVTPPARKSSPETKDD